MKFQIFYETTNGEDNFVIEGDTLDEVRKEADAELVKRGVDIGSAWSVEL